MAKADKRFETVYSQGMTEGVKILVDKATGVHYMLAFKGYAGGLTVLLDKDGKPVIGEADSYFSL
ncbi:MAG: hypothetical protein IKI88_07870 [Anaerotignum sp.]|nr:hypothetical protein [Anaerotignum sp.]